MKLFHVLIPNLAISLNISLMVLIYLDMRNPMMGFLSGTPFLVLAIACCACSILSGAVLYGTYRKQRSKPVSNEKNLE